MIIVDSNAICCVILGEILELATHLFISCKLGWLRWEFVLPPYLLHMFAGLGARVKRGLILVLHLVV